MLHKANTEFREGWRILLVALLGVVTSPHYLGLYSFGPLVPDLTEALDIPIGELQRAITFNFIGIAIGSQLGGWLLVRFEPKTVTLCSLLLFSALYAVLSFIEITRNTLYFFYLVLPLVGSGALLVTWTQLACLHFEKKRGIALAIVLSGGGVISAVAPLLLSTLTGTEHWQLAFLLLALLPLTTFFICLFALPKSHSSELA
ncbi:MAG: MFS transporter, partial [Pseudomonadales bacterium]|nr:MFS transporter [Pseudomonadales bacterium]